MYSKTWYAVFEKRKHILKMLGLGDIILQKQNSLLENIDNLVGI